MRPKGPGAVSLCLRSAECVLAAVIFLLLIALAAFKGFPVHGDVADLARSELSERSRHWPAPASDAEAVWHDAVKAMLSAGDRTAFLDAFAQEELARAAFERTERGPGAGSGAAAQSSLHKALVDRGETTLPLTTAQLEAWPFVAALPGRVPPWAWPLPALAAWLSWARRTRREALLGQVPASSQMVWARSVAVPFAGSLALEAAVALSAFLLAAVLRGPGDPAYPVAVVDGAVPHMLRASRVALRALAMWSLTSFGACATLSAAYALCASVPAAVGVLVSVAAVSLLSGSPYAPPWLYGADGALPQAWDVASVSGALSFAVGDGGGPASARLVATAAFWAAAMLAIGAAASPLHQPRPRKASHACRP